MGVPTYIITNQLQLNDLDFLKKFLDCLFSGIYAMILPKTMKGGTNRNLSTGTMRIREWTIQN